MSVYAIADLHGRLDLFEQVKAFLKPEDKVYVLGDCGDRGPEPWETIKRVYNDPQFIYIKGNHEDMLIKAMKAHLRHHNEFPHEYNLCRRNGGEGTYKSWLKESIEDKEFWYRALSNLPLDATYLNKDMIHIYMNHSGADENSSEKEILWSRDHFFHWTSDYDLIVHGHTPIPLMDEEFAFYEKNHTPLEPGAYWYDLNRKVNIDCGAVWTGVTVLLDLDTFDEHIFFQA